MKPRKDADAGEIAQDLLAEKVLQVEDEYGRMEDGPMDNMKPYLERLGVTWEEIDARATGILAVRHPGWER